MCEEKTLDRSPVPPLEAWIKTRQADAPAWPNNRSGGSSKAYAGNAKNFRRRSAATDKQSLSDHSSSAHARSLAAPAISDRNLAISVVSSAMRHNNPSIAT